MGVMMPCRFYVFKVLQSKALPLIFIFMMCFGTFYFLPTDYIGVSPFESLIIKIRNDYYEKMWQKTNIIEYDYSLTYTHGEKKQMAVRRFSGNPPVMYSFITGISTLDYWFRFISDPTQVPSCVNNGNQIEIIKAEYDKQSGYPTHVIYYEHGENKPVTECWISDFKIFQQTAIQ
ncbi:MAG: hypothetical protein PHE50_07825 [Dehalococcoidales bacterium]|nr:hypothetical protein [Dehalococcoidales bacterium]